MLTHTTKIVQSGPRWEAHPPLSAQHQGWTGRQYSYTPVPGECKDWLKNKMPWREVCILDSKLSNSEEPG